MELIFKHYLGLIRFSVFCARYAQKKGFYPD
jgi:hypothetical protein